MKNLPIFKYNVFYKDHVFINSLILELFLMLMLMFLSGYFLNIYFDRSTIFIVLSFFIGILYSTYRFYFFTVSLLYKILRQSKHLKKNYIISNENK